MARPITAKIDVTKIDKAHLFRGQKGVYLDLIIWPNRNGPGERGDTHYIVQGVSKEKREAKVKGAIIGNLRMPEEENQQERQQPASAPKPPDGASPDITPDDIPF